MYVKCHNETNYYVQLIHANKNYGKISFEGLLFPLFYLSFFLLSLSEIKLNSFH